jgi:hypothetical protein
MRERKRAHCAEPILPACLQKWDNPVESCFVAAAVVLTALRPSLVLPCLLAWLVWARFASKPSSAGWPLSCTPPLRCTGLPAHVEGLLAWL